MPVQQGIHRRIQVRMQALGVTQADVAKGLGMASSSVSDWFRKGALPDGAAMLALPKVLKCSANWLLLNTGPMETVEGAARDHVLRAEGAHAAILDMRELLDELQEATASGGGGRSPAERARVASVRRVLKERKAGDEKDQRQPKTG